MKSLTTSILVAAMLAHPLLGCCVHHADASNPTDGPTPVARAEDCHHHHHHAHQTPANEATPLDSQGDHPEPCGGHHRCDDAKCSFARIETPPEVEVLAAGGVGTLPVAVLPVKTTVPLAHRSLDTIFFSTGFPGMALRRHLALAILII